MASGQLWSSFLLKIMIKRKRKLDSLIFKEENNSKAFKNCQVIRPRESTFKRDLKIRLFDILVKHYKSAKYCDKSLIALGLII